MTLKKTLSLFTAAASMGLAVPAFAVDFVWNNNHGTNDWQDPKSWDRQSGFPGSGDKATFPINASGMSNVPGTVGEIDVTSGATLTLPAVTVAIGAVALSGSSSQLTFASSAVVTCSTACTIASGTTLTVPSGAELRLAGSISNSGTFTNSSGAVTRIDANAMDINFLSAQAGTIRVHALLVTNSSAFTLSGPMIIDASYSFNPGAAFTIGGSQNLTVDGIFLNDTVSPSNGGTITIDNGGEARFVNKNLTGTGNLVLASGGLFKALDGTCTIAATQSITDVSGSVWHVEDVSSAAVLEFLANQSLNGDFEAPAANSSIKVTSFTVGTGGAFTWSPGLICSHVIRTSGAFNTASGNCQ